MQIRIKNLPSNAAADKILVEFHVNTTATSVMLGSGTPALLVQIPRSLIARTITLKIHLLELGVTLKFAAPFVFRVAPQPRVTRVIPASASIESSSLVRISVKDFPMVSSSSDVKVRFKWASGTEVAVVATRVSSKGVYAIQDIDVDIQTPVGTEVQLGKPDIIVFHNRFGESLAAVLQNAFTVTDPLSPYLSQISSFEGVGVNEVSVPMSVAADVTMMVDNAPREVDTATKAYYVQVDGMLQDILSAQVSSSRQARIVFSTFPKSASRVVNGIISFGQSCSSTCCIDMSCAMACPVKSACFLLDYFDDTLPLLTIKSDQIGPSIGGDILRLELRNFPALAAEDDVSVRYILQGLPGFINDVVVTSSNSERTDLLIVTPEFKGVERDEYVEISVVPKSDSRKAVTFSYLVEAVRAEIAAFSPSAGFATGGSTILVEIAYFPYPTQVLVRFNALSPLPDDSIKIMPISTKLKTKLRISSPATAPGQYQVTISPKICSDPCAQAVTFTYVQVDPSMPQVVAPIPVGNSFQKAFLPSFYISNMPSIPEFTVTFVNEEGTVAAEVKLLTSSAVQESAMTGVKMVSIITPGEIVQAGKFYVSLIFALQGDIIKKTDPINFEFFDGLIPRLLATNPAVLPTNAVISGTTLNLKTSRHNIKCEPRTA